MVVFLSSGTPSSEELFIAEGDHQRPAEQPGVPAQADLAGGPQRQAGDLRRAGQSYKTFLQARGLYNKTLVS